MGTMYIIFLLLVIVYTCIKNIREDFVSINPFLNMKKIKKFNKYMYSKKKYLEKSLNKKMDVCYKSVSSLDNAVKCINPMYPLLV